MTATYLLVLATSALWLASLVAGVLFFQQRLRLAWKPALLFTYPLWWFAQLLITKVLGLANSINQSALLVATALLFLGPIIFVLIRSWNPAVKAARVPLWPRFGTAVRSYWLEGVTLLYIGLTSIKAALLCPSRVWDAHTYHLPIVGNWLQQGSLRPWPTNCLRQITRPGGAEIQQLWVIGLPHADLLSELPSLLAAVVVLVFVWEVARRWGASNAVGLAAGVSIFAVPQIYWSALSATDGLLMTTGLLCCIYNALASFSEPRPGLAFAYAALAAVSASLVCATKVPGLLFGGLFMVFFALVLLMARMGRRLLVVAVVFVVSALPAFALQYADNLRRYGRMYAESVGPLDSSPEARWIKSSALYVLRLLFADGTRGVGTDHDRTNYGVWFSLIVLPLVFLANWKALTGTFMRRPDWKSMLYKSEKVFVAAYSLVALGATVCVHPLSNWDQRFLVWVVPVTLLFAMPAAERYISPIFFRLLCLVFALAVVRSVLALGYLPSGKSPDPRDVPGYELMAEAQPGDTVLYVGGEDTPQYPCWGWRMDRTVWAADNVSNLGPLFERQPRWVVVEDATDDTMRSATLEMLSSRNYTRILTKEMWPDAPSYLRRSIWRR